MLVQNTSESFDSIGDIYKCYNATSTDENNNFNVDIDANIIDKSAVECILKKSNNESELDESSCDQLTVNHEIKSEVFNKDNSDNKSINNVSHAVPESKASAKLKRSGELTKKLENLPTIGKYLLFGASVVIAFFKYFFYFF